MHEHMDMHAMHGDGHAGSVEATSVDTHVCS